ncbi:MAG: hypothetical protein ABSD74_19145 [Rhizomicrobium sp.]
MRKFFSSVCLGTLLALGAPWPGSANQPQGSQAQPANALAAMQAQVSDAYRRLQGNDFKGAVDELLPIVSDPGFSGLPSEAQFLTQATLGLAYAQLNDFSTAQKYFKQATRTQFATGELWSMRLFTAYKLDDPDDEVTSLTSLAQMWPDQLSNHGDGFIFQVERLARSLAGGQDRDLALLGALFAAHWHPSDVFNSADALWLRLARLKLERGDPVGAANAAAAIETTGSVINVRIDKRFDSLVKADPSRFDIDATLARDLATVRAQAAAAPDKLEGINETATILITVNKPDEALAILDDAIAKAEAGKAKKQPFSDYDDQINWAENNRAIALGHLGRFDEALAQLAKAAAKPEDGNPNVSQAINLAEAYDDAGRPKEALAAVENLEMGTPSPYGRMSLQYARACAYAQLHDDINLEKSIAYIKAHAADAPTVYSDALLCTNDLDGAAKAYLEALDNPEQRTATLYRFQTFLKPAHQQPVAAEFDRRFAEVRDRADIRAKIELYGRIISLPIIDINDD